MSEPLWRISEIAEAVKGEVFGDGNVAVTGISIDSRTVAPGDLYIAIVGDVHDGHKFVQAALDAGAACALVRDDFEPSSEKGNLVKVADTLRGMELLGIAARARTSAKVLAITGSVGKTGTKESLRQCLAVQGKTHASVKSFNNHWGVPISLSRMPVDTDYGVFEVGMNHPGEITPLSKFIKPSIAIITTVEPVHIEFFDSVEQIAAAKAEIFDGMEPGGTAILNRDNPHFAFLKTQAEGASLKIVAFGEHENADVRLKGLEEHADRSVVDADILGQKIRFTLSMPGKHLVMNNLAVLAAVKLAGGDVEKAAGVLGTLEAQDGRGAKEVFAHPDGDVLVFDESYNANPASMRAAIAGFSQATTGLAKRRILVLGDMLELGELSSQLHEDLFGPIQSADIDLLFACGEFMRGLFDRLPPEKQGAYALTSEDLTSSLLGMVSPGDGIMIKGSLGSRMGPVVEALKSHLRSVY